MSPAASGIDGSALATTRLLVDAPILGELAHGPGEQARVLLGMPQPECEQGPAGRLRVVALIGAVRDAARLALWLPLAAMRFESGAGAASVAVRVRPRHGSPAGARL